MAPHKKQFCLYGHDTASTGRRRRACVACERENMQARRHFKKVTDLVGMKRSKKTHDLWSNYGITLKDYENLLELQNGVCAICKRPPFSRRLDVDHNHQSGAVRGLLCPNCNAGIGNLKDNSALLRSAAEYLEQFDD